MSSVRIFLTVFDNYLIDNAHGVALVAIALHQDHLLLEAPILAEQWHGFRGLALVELLIRLVVWMAGMSGVKGPRARHRLAVSLLLIFCRLLRSVFDMRL